MHHITQEQAERLKAAGFPQPQPSNGQVWFQGGQARVVNHPDPPQLFKGIQSAYHSSNNEITFAPTVTYILQELGNRTQKHLWWTFMPPIQSDPNWECSLHIYLEEKFKTFLGRNPFDALIEAYIWQKSSENNYRVLAFQVIEREVLPPEGDNNIENFFPF